MAPGLQINKRDAGLDKEVCLVDVNAGGGAALGLAAGRGRLEMVKFLLSKGAKPTADALQYARTRGHQEIEKILVEAGAKE